MLQNKNEIWVDISKGIVICLMVIGHSSLPTSISRWIWSFHMPFFFIISALFTSWDKLALSSFIKRKSKILLIPFIVYSIVNLLLIPIGVGMPHISYAIQIFREGWGGIALWFVPVFYLSIIVCKVCPIDKLIIIGFALMAVGAILSYNSIIIPWTISSVPFAASIMLLTRKYKYSIRRTIHTRSTKKLILIGSIGLLVSLVVSHFWRLDMACNSITPLFPILLGIIGGTTFVISISVLFQNCKLFKFTFGNIGRNTYEIMALSQVTIIMLNHYFNLPSFVKYVLLAAILFVAVKLRKLIEGKLTNIEAI